LSRTPTPSKPKPIKNMSAGSGVLKTLPPQPGLPLAHPVTLIASGWVPNEKFTPLIVVSAVIEALDSVKVAVWSSIGLCEPVSRDPVSTGLGPTSVCFGGTPVAVAIVSVELLMQTAQIVFSKGREGGVAVPKPHPVATELFAGVHKPPVQVISDAELVIVVEPLRMPVLRRNSMSVIFWATVVLPEFKFFSVITSCPAVGVKSTSPDVPLLVKKIMVFADDKPAVSTRIVTNLSIL